MQAMILAAGFGTRLRPHTTIKPKPLFPILNTPLLLLSIKRLQRLGFDHIIVNCHYLKEQIVDALQPIPGVVVQEEESVLGTGGGLFMATSLMRDEPIFITNGDIYHSINIVQFYDFHCHNRNKITLAMHDYPRFNTVHVAGDQVSSFEKDGLTSKLAFTGLHMIHPVLLEKGPTTKLSCIIEYYRHLLNQGEAIHVFRSDDCFWTDMGTEQDYLQLHEDLLLERIPKWQELDTLTGPHHVKDNGGVSSSAKYEDWVSIGRASGGQNSVLSKCVVWDDVVIPKEEQIRWKLLST